MLAGILHRINIELKDIIINQNLTIPIKVIITPENPQTSLPVVNMQKSTYPKSVVPADMLVRDR